MQNEITMPAILDRLKEWQENIGCDIKSGSWGPSEVMEMISQESKIAMAIGLLSTVGDNCNIHGSQKTNWKFYYTPLIDLREGNEIVYYAPHLRNETAVRHNKGERGVIKSVYTDGRVYVNYYNTDFALGSTAKLTPVEGIQLYEW